MRLERTDCALRAGTGPAVDLRLVERRSAGIGTEKREALLDPTERFDGIERRLLRLPRALRLDEIEFVDQYL